MRNRVVVVTAMAAFALGVGGLAVVAARSGGPGTGGDLPRLPVETAAAGSGSAADAASPSAARGMPYRLPAPVEYRLAPGVDQPADHARAYRLPTVTADQVAALGQRLHVNAAPASHGTDWALDDGSHMLFVDGAGQWTYGPSGSGGVASSSGMAVCAPCPPGRLCAQVCQPPARPEGTPTRDEAERAAAAFWQHIGVDPGAAKPVVEDGFSQWTVRFPRLIGGVPVSYDDTTAVVGAHSVVLSATGRIGMPRLVGGYPLVSLAEAVTRLNHQLAQGPGCWTATPRCETPMMGGPAATGSVNPTPRRLGPPETAGTAGGTAGTSGTAQSTNTTEAPPPTTTSLDQGPADTPATATTVPVEPGIHSPTPQSQPTRVVMLTTVRLGLEVVDGYLVPVYLFGTADGTAVAPVSAVPDRLLITPRQPEITTTSADPKTLETTTSR
jgi:hypothetical protein